MFKGLTARRLYKSFGVKVLKYLPRATTISNTNIKISNVNWPAVLGNNVFNHIRTELHSCLFANNGITLNSFIASNMLLLF
jgi:hypothetical protein